MDSPPKDKGGRPPKFKEARRPVTVTLPERILEALATVDIDRARAIVKAVEAYTAMAQNAEPVKLVEVEPGVAMIEVGPSRTLQQIPWIKLVEIAPQRFLISVPADTPTERLEVALSDALETLVDSDYERQLVEALYRQLTHLRRLDRMSRSEMIFVDLKTHPGKAGRTRADSGRPIGQLGTASQTA